MPGRRCRYHPTAHLVVDLPISTRTGGHEHANAVIEERTMIPDHTRILDDAPDGALRQPPP